MAEIPQNLNKTDGIKIPPKGLAILALIGQLAAPAMFGYFCVFQISYIF